MKRILIAGLIALAGCSQAQLGSAVTTTQNVTAAVAQACADAQPLLPLAMAIPTVGPFVAVGVQVGCGTSAGLAKLAADPTSAEWLGQQIGIMKAAIGAH